MGEHKFIAKLSSPEDKLLLHKSVLWPLPCHPFFLPRKSEDDQIYNQPDTKKKGWIWIKYGGLCLNLDRHKGKVEVDCTWDGHPNHSLICLHVVTLPHVVSSQKHVQCPNIHPTEIPSSNYTARLQTREQKIYRSGWSRNAYFLINLQCIVT